MTNPNKLIFSNISNTALLKLMKVTSEKLRLPESHTEMLLALMQRLIVLGSKQGSQRLIDYVKSIRVSIYRWRAKMKPIFPADMVARDRDGLPKILKDCRKIIRSSDDDFLRGILTVLQLSYLLKGNKTPQTSGIEEPSSITPETIDRFQEFMDDNSDVILKKSTLNKWKAPHLTVKAGPNGHALGTCGEDLELIDDSLAKAIETLGGEMFIPWFRMWRRSPYQLKRVSAFLHRDMKIKKNKTLRNLTYVDSPEGKKRVIAIFDYWSQTVLKPIHDWSFDQLKKFKSDCTFNQNRARHAGNWEFADSIDLSAATDRFPLEIQKVVLNKYIGVDKTDAWAKILVDYEFTVSWKKDKLRNVKYQSGQPMGAYSSWGVFALSHHFTVQYAAKRAGANLPFTRYLLLGDDLVIFNQEVACEYRKVISEFGVKISEDKSITSNDCFEFAKRFFTKNKEITPFPLASIAEVGRSPMAMWATLLVAEERGYDLAKGVLRPWSVADFAAITCPTIRRKKVLQEVQIMESIHILSDPRANQNEASWSVKSLVTHLGLPVSCNIREGTLRNILSALLSHCAIMNKLNQITGAGSINGYRAEVILDHPAFDTDVTSMDDQSVTAVDATLSPQLWILAESREESQVQIHELKSFDSAPTLSQVLAKVAVPTLEMSRLVSRRVNSGQLARFGTFVRFLREAVKTALEDRRAALS